MKLSGSQLFWMVATITLIMPLGVAISPTIAIAKQDAWISLIITGSVCLLIGSLLARLGLAQPNLSFTGSSIRIFGRWIGTLVVAPYILVWIAISSVALRSMVDFFQSTLLNKTPSWIIMIIVLSLMLYLVHGGLSVIGRFSEIVGPVFFLLVILSFIFNIKNINIDKIVPVFGDNELLTVIKGVVPSTPLIGVESVMLLVLMQFIRHPKNAPFQSAVAVATSSFILVIAAIMILLVFGPELSIMINTPYFELVRAIDIMDFIQNLDVFFVVVALFGTAILLSSHLFIVAYETSIWFGMKNWKFMLWVVTLVVWIIATYLPTVTYQSFFLKWLSVVGFPYCVIFIPLCLWIGTIFKKSSR